MGYPLIILGAGASFDCLNKTQFTEPDYFRNELDKYRPPLANDLFDTKRFSEIMDGYEPYISEISSYCLNKLISKKQTLEEILTDYRYNKIMQNPDIDKQIIAFRYYLSDLFVKISDNYFRTINNYNTLIQCIKLTGRKAFIVNFNYDLIFERTLFGTFPKNIDDYISGDIKVCKIHGACDWFYGRKINASQKKSSYDYALVGAQNILENETKKYDINIQKVDLAKNANFVYDGSFSGTMQIPAIALPLKGKQSFICPDDQIKILETTLNIVDRIIIIGWSAGDMYLVDKLRNSLGERNVPVALVCGKKSKDVIWNNLGSLAKNINMNNEEGFQSFLATNQCEEFLNA